MKLNLSVKDLMSTEVLKVSKGDSVLSVATRMRDKNIGSAIVVEKERVVGIVTERDLAFKMLPDGRDPKGTGVGEIMVSPVTTVDAPMDVTEAADLMRRKNFRRLPVVDGGRLVGIITQTDIADVEPDLVRLMQRLLAARDEKGAGDLIGKYYQETKAREEFDRIKNRKKRDPPQEGREGAAAAGRQE